MQNKVTIFTVLALLLVFTACKDNSIKLNEILNNKTFYLEKDKDISIAFQNDSFSFNNKLNIINGSFHIDNNYITFANIIATLRSGDLNDMEQDMKLGNWLLEKHKIQLKENILEIGDKKFVLNKD